jgi:hypothetical protein
VKVCLLTRFRGKKAAASAAALRSRCSFISSWALCLCFSAKAPGYWHKHTQRRPQTRTRTNTNPNGTEALCSSWRPHHALFFLSL